MFKDFGKRLQRDVKRITEDRLQRSMDLSGGQLKVISLSNSHAVYPY
jgi:actin-related protein 3